MSTGAESKSKPGSKDDQRPVQSEDQGQAPANEKPKLVNAIKSKVKKFKSVVKSGGAMIPLPLLLEDAKPKEEIKYEAADDTYQKGSIPQNDVKTPPAFTPPNKIGKILGKKVAGAFKWRSKKRIFKSNRSVEDHPSVLRVPLVRPAVPASAFVPKQELPNAAITEVSAEIPKGIAKIEQFSNEAKSAMRQWLVNLSQGGVYRLRKEFYMLRNYVPPNAEATCFAANPTLCRYRDVTCYDSTRVVLTWPEDCKNDFIHANWVKHELISNVFICTQAPKAETLYDFWRMIWQEKTGLIIMLCNIMENNRRKCLQYWPEAIGQTMHLDKLILKTLNVDASDSSVRVTKLQIQCGHAIRVVYHRHWVNWPDKSVPKSPMGVFRILQYARQEKQPVVVHCSAGIGRTGTLVLTEMILNCLKRGNMPDAMQYVRILRSQRAQAVQTEDQYVFTHYAVVHMLYVKKVFTARDISGFCKDYLNYIKMLDSLDRKRFLPLSATPAPAHGTAITCCEADTSESKKKKGLLSSNAQPVCESAKEYYEKNLEPEGTQEFDEIEIEDNDDKFPSRTSETSRGSDVR